MKHLNPVVPAYENYFQQFFSIVGLWLPETQTTLYKLYIFLIQPVFFYAYTFFKCMYIFELKSVGEASILAFVCLTEIALILKMINFLFKNTFVRENHRLIKEFVFENDDECKVFSEKIRIFRYIFVAFWTLTAATGVFSYSIPFFEDESTFPYLAWYPWDWHHNRRTWWILYVYQVTGMLVQSNVLIGLELYCVYLLIVLSAYISILSTRLNNIGYKSGEKESTGDKAFNNSDISILKFTECIEQHQYLLRCAKNVEIIFALPYFIQVITSGLVLGFIVFQLATTDPAESMTEFLFYFTFVIVLLFQIFLPSYFSSELTLSFSNMRYAIYQSNWIRLSTKYKKNMIFFMEKMKHDTVLKAARFIPMSRETFTSILNRSYGLFALLQKTAK